MDQTTPPARRNERPPVDVVGALLDQAPATGGHHKAVQYEANFEEALQAAEQAIQLAPKDLGGWRAKGQALRDLGRFEEALQAAETSIELEPNKGRGSWLRASAWNILAIDRVQLEVDNLLGVGP